MITKEISEKIEQNMETKGIVKDPFWVNAMVFYIWVVIEAFPGYNDIQIKKLLKTLNYNEIRMLFSGLSDKKKQALSEEGEDSFLNLPSKTAADIVSMLNTIDF